jgi:WD40 repeat protein
MYSQDGQRVLTASNDGTARLWQTEPSDPSKVWKALAEFKGHQGPVHFAAFSPPTSSPTGPLIVTASNDSTVRVWRIDDPKHFNTLEAHGGPVYFAAFSPNGQHIVAASWDRKARLWSLPISASQSIKVIQQQLALDNHDCLVPELRQFYFNEDESQARQRFDDCEQTHGRGTPPAWVIESEHRTSGPPRRSL